MDTGDLSSLLGGVLENPDVMKKILGALSATGSASHQTNEAREEETAPEQSGGEQWNEARQELPSNALTALAGGLSGEEAKKRKRLISALEPYLGEQRRDVAHKLLMIMEVVSAGGLFK